MLPLSPEPRPRARSPASRARGRRRSPDRGGWQSLARPAAAAGDLRQFRIDPANSPAARCAWRASAPRAAGSSNTPAPAPDNQPAASTCSRSATAARRTRLRHVASTGPASSASQTASAGSACDTGNRVCNWASRRICARHAASSGPPPACALSSLSRRRSDRADDECGDICVHRPAACGRRGQRPPPAPWQLRSASPIGHPSAGWNTAYRIEQIGESRLRAGIGAFATRRAAAGRRFAGSRRNRNAPAARQPNCRPPRGRRPPPADDHVRVAVLRGGNAAPIRPAKAQFPPAQRRQRIQQSDRPHHQCGVAVASSAATSRPGAVPGLPDGQRGARPRERVAATDDGAAAQRMHAVQAHPPWREPMNVHPRPRSPPS